MNIHKKDKTTPLRVILIYRFNSFKYENFWVYLRFRRVSHIRNDQLLYRWCFYTDLIIKEISRLRLLNSKDK